MPQGRRDNKTGALIFRPTPDEQHINKLTKSQKQILSGFSDIMEKLKIIETKLDQIIGGKNG